MSVPVCYTYSNMGENCINMVGFCKTKKGLLFRVLSVSVLLICLLGTIFYVRARKNYTLSSDESSEIVLGNVLASENALLSKNWYYSTEISVLNTNVFYSFFFHLTDNWHRVRMLSTVSMYLVLLASYYGLSRVFRFRRNFALTAAVLFIPFSEVYYHIVLLGAYYFPVITASVLILMLSGICLKTDGWKARGVLAFSFIFSVLIGMGGARQLLVTYIPLLAAAVILLFVRKNDGQMKKWFLFALTVFAGSVIGYGINAQILVRHFTFETWNDVTFTGLDFSRLSEILNGFLYSFGYVNGNVFSAAMLTNAVSVAWILLSVYAVWYAFRNRETVSGELLRLAGFTAAVYVIYILFYAFTSTLHHHRYNLPIIVLSLPLAALFLEQVNWKKAISSAILVILVLATAVCGLLFYVSGWKEDRNEEMRKMADFLVSEGYYNGYSSFWRGHIITEFSNGQVDVWIICDDSNDQAFLRVEDIDQTYHWLQKVSHDTTHPSGKVFLLFTEGEYHNNIWNLDQQDEGQIIYQSPDYVILGYEDYDDMINHLYPGYDFVFGDDRWLENGKDTGGHREIYYGGVSFGPYVTLWPGTHEVTVKGKNLREAVPFCSSESGAKPIEIRLTRHDDEEIDFTFVLDEKSAEAETIIRNMSDAPDSVVTVDSISIRRKTD